MISVLEFRAVRISAVYFKICLHCHHIQRVPPGFPKWGNCLALQKYTIPLKWPQIRLVGKQSSLTGTRLNYFSNTYMQPPIQSLGSCMGMSVP